MPYLTRYGSVYGYVPAFTGRIFYVAPGAAGGGSNNTATYTVDGQAFSASDTNDGLSPQRALASLTKAITLSNTPTAMSSPSAGTSQSAGTFDDVIVLLPGLHNVDANAAVTPAVTNNRLLITGVPGTNDLSSTMVYPKYRSRTQLQASVALDLLQLQGNDIEIANLQFNLSTAKNGISVTAATKGLFIHDCVFNAYGVAASVSTKCIKMGAFVSSFVDIVRNTFLTDAAQGPWIDFTGSTVTDVNMLENWFVHQTGTLAVGVQAAAGLDRVLYAYNQHLCGGGGTVTVGFDGTNASISGGVLAANNSYANQGYTLISGIFKNWGAANTKIQLYNNYQAFNSSAGASSAVTSPGNNVITAT